ncbi:MAG: CDP-diacylglycerol--glycerol-3-phosphate 3-phosphatidyltransferase [Spirochaetaceae bacterium]|nr:CDP-diacylglycerol--glycerol-3-phosphate 3-phosphatidyltransferase [Spirochaetaceae bacterium]
MRIADKFTLARIVLAPVFFVIFFSSEWFGFDLSASVFIMVPLLIFAEFTDFLDGFFARKLGQVSDFGKLFDPFADVLLHLTTFFCFVLSGYLSPLIFLLILYREMSMNFVRMLALKKGVAIGARIGGKLKTVLYVVTGFFFLAIECFKRFGCDLSSMQSIFGTLGTVLSVLCLLVSYISFIEYLVCFKSVLNIEEV